MDITWISPCENPANAMFVWSLRKMHGSRRLKVHSVIPGPSGPVITIENDDGKVLQRTLRGGPLEVGWEFIEPLQKSE
jgi:hypothetical protein